jgi:hypothetical protein
VSFSGFSYALFLGSGLINPILPGFCLLMIIIEVLKGDSKNGSR